jgi:thiosulfate/3-mercaptopyruvate sulfurtransferase
MKLAVSFTAFALTLAAAPALRSNLLVSTDWLSQHLNDDKVVVLHVSANRTAYDAGHIPGARFLALGDITVTRNAVPNELPGPAELKKAFDAVGVSDDTRVILVADTNVLAATRAFFTLDYLGHGDKTAMLDGGLGKWTSEGRMLSKDVPAPKSGNFTPRPQAELLVSMETVSQVTQVPSASNPILLDVRSGPEYRGEKGAHIPTALNANWVDSQLSRENQALKPEADLRKLYEAAGLKGDKPVVTYCNSGMQASQSYFTLKYLGYDVKLYDGSLSEWNAKGGALEK